MNNCPSASRTAVEYCNPAHFRQVGGHARYTNAVAARRQRARTAFLLPRRCSCAGWWAPCAAVYPSDGSGQSFLKAHRYNVDGLTSPRGATKHQGNGPITGRILRGAQLVLRRWAGVRACCRGIPGWRRRRFAAGVIRQHGEAFPILGMRELQPPQQTRAAGVRQARRALDLRQRDSG